MSTNITACIYCGEVAGSYHKSTCPLSGPVKAPATTQPRVSEQSDDPLRDLPDFDAKVQARAALDRQADERALFEKSMNDARFFPAELSFARTKSPSGRDEYANSHLQSCWVGWQARAAIQHAAPKAPTDTQPVGEIVIFGSDCKEVAWRKGKMHAPGTKLYSSPVAAPEAPASEQQEITRLDILSLIHAQCHRSYASAIDREEIDTKYMVEIEDALRAVYADAEATRRGRALGGKTNAATPAATTASTQDALEEALACALSEHTNLSTDGIDDCVPRLVATIPAAALPFDIVPTEGIDPALYERATTASASGDALDLVQRMRARVETVDKSSGLLLLDAAMMIEHLSRAPAPSREAAPLANTRRDALDEAFAAVSRATATALVRGPYLDARNDALNAIRALAHQRAAQAAHAGPAPTLMRQAVGSVASNADGEIRINWMRPERCEVGVLLYALDRAAMSAAIEKEPK